MTVKSHLEQQKNSSMKVLKLHPLMTISLLQMQIQRLLFCNVAVYVRNSLANTFDTLKEAGFEEDVLIEFPIDETLSLREFEEEVEERFNFSLELCNKDNKPFMNKSQHLFQIARVASDRKDDRNYQLDISLDMLTNNHRQQPPQNMW
ncbi:RWD domain-containing protein [Chitinophaga sp. 180180018-2]